MLRDHIFLFISITWHPGSLTTKNRGYQHLNLATNNSIAKFSNGFATDYTYYFLNISNRIQQRKIHRQHKVCNGLSVANCKNNYLNLNIKPKLYRSLITFDMIKSQPFNFPAIANSTLAVLSPHTLRNLNREQ